MRRTASEVIRDLETRIAQLEGKTAGESFILIAEDGDMIKINNFNELKAVLKGNAFATFGRGAEVALNRNGKEYRGDARAFIKMVAESLGTKTVYHF